MLPHGEVRARWQLFRNCCGWWPQESNRRWEQARRLIHENGVDLQRPRRPARPRPPLGARRAAAGWWTRSEWATLSAALVQRATLLNAVLADLYGPQNAAARGAAARELVFGRSDAFLRPCHGWAVPRRSLPAPVRRRTWRARRRAIGACVADRTEAPVGAGYAVENRIVISRMIPHVFPSLPHRAAGRVFHDPARLAARAGYAETETIRTPCC